MVLGRTQPELSKDGRLGVSLKDVGCTASVASCSYGGHDVVQPASAGVGICSSSSATAAYAKLATSCLQKTWPPGELLIKCISHCLLICSN